MFSHFGSSEDAKGKYKYMCPVTFKTLTNRHVQTFCSDFRHFPQPLFFIFYFFILFYFYLFIYF